MLRSFLMILVLFSLSIHDVMAGQGYIRNDSGDPVLWVESTDNPIPMHMESGDCGRFSNAEMQTRFAAALSEWANVTYADVSFEVISGSIDGVDGCNYGDYLADVIGSTDSSAAVNDSLNPVLFDNDGEIIDSATGYSNGRYFILGFANPAGYYTDASGAVVQIVDAQAVFNCYCLDTADGGYANSNCESAGLKVDSDTQYFTMIHEMGHVLNLDHSQNNAVLEDAYLPTMFPSSENATEQMTPTEDDIVALASLYPASGFFSSGDAVHSSYCLVTGTLLDRVDFGNELRCADVNAVASDDNAKNISMVSGVYGAATDNNSDGDTQDSGECTSGCGDFQLYLQPGTTYTLKVESISSTYVGGSGISPCDATQLSACVAGIVTKCTDADTSTTCVPCVEDGETLTTNDNGDNIADLISAGCTAGATVALGDITTSSVAIESAASVNASLSEIPSLVASDSPSLTEEFLSTHLLPARFSKKYASSCPESGSSTGSSSSSGCSLSSDSCIFHQARFGVRSQGLFLVLLVLAGLILKRFPIKI